MGCQEYNQRGNALSEYLATTKLEIVNRGCEYTFCSGNKCSIIEHHDSYKYKVTSTVFTQLARGQPRHYV